MNKICVIDLLNKIANGEELPKKVKYYDLTYEYNEHLIGINKYRGIEHKGIFLFDVVSNINDEVEIIEEDKKIEKLENEKQFYSYRKYADIKNDIDKILYIIKGLNLTEEKIDNLNNKINEIIDKLEG